MLEAIGIAHDTSTQEMLSTADISVLRGFLNKCLMQDFTSNEKHCTSMDVAWVVADATTHDKNYLLFLMEFAREERLVR